MRTWIVVAALAMATSASQAQSKTCRGKLMIDSVYQNGIGGTNYEYFVQIRNTTAAPLHWVLNFTNLPKGAIAFSPQLTSGATTLAPYSSQTIKFGKGTNGNVNTNTVLIGYDVSGKNLTATNCF